MPRKPRIWFPGAIYHIICRGNRRQDIFKDDKDRRVYLSILKECCEKYPFLLYAYCLMTNHLHLQVETLDEEIAKIMKLINMQYTMYFNKRYNLVGHLFQGRYHSELILTDAHNLLTSKYIHLNPVRAEIVDNPLDYPWSSYPVYAGKKNNPMVSTDKILGYFQKDSQLYRKYVEAEA
ncbi:MAG: transposase [Bacillota bacterium]